MVFFRKPRIFKYKFLFIATLIICCLNLMLKYHKITNIRQCYKRPAEEHEEALKIGSTKRLVDVLTGSPKPTLGKSIFFHETSCHQPLKLRSILNFITLKPSCVNYVNLTTRAACAIESAAFHNPHLDVFVLFASPSYWDNDTDNAIIKAVVSYPNIHLRNLDLWRYASQTPLEEWLETDELFKSRYISSHMSDFLRYLTLWHFGGTYLDTDVVVLRSLEDIPPNFTGAESEKNLAAGVMNFGFDDIGRKVAEYCLNDFQRNFNGQKRNRNGPGVITRAMEHFCGTNKTADMFDKSCCRGFQVYKRNVFYAVPYWQWKDLFDKSKTDSILKRLQNSIVTHVWNYYSERKNLRVGDRSAYTELAAKHCPKVFASLTHNF